MGEQVRGRVAAGLGMAAGDGLYDINREYPKVCVNLQTDVR